MSYSNVETTMQTILASVSGLSAATVTKGDDSVLDKGVTAAAVIEPGGIATTPIQGRQSINTWVCNVSLYVRYTTKSATHSAFVTLRDAVIARLQTYYPDVGNLADNPFGLAVESITTQNDPQDITMQNTPTTGPVFRAQTLTVAVSETALIGAT